MQHILIWNLVRYLKSGRALDCVRMPGSNHVAENVKDPKFVSMIRRDHDVKNARVHKFVHTDVSSGDVKNAKVLKFVSTIA